MCVCVCAACVCVCMRACMCDAHVCMWVCVCPCVYAHVCMPMWVASLPVTRGVEQPNFLGRIPQPVPFDQLNLLVMSIIPLVVLVSVGCGGVSWLCWCQLVVLVSVGYVRASWLCWCQLVVLLSVGCVRVSWLCC